ncbi:MAG: PilZ domain-containing protein [Archangium sp.]|nr:PilZ domain-containing protein [Archangium sp.]
MNKRLLPRLRRRLQVWLGDRPAFTSDVSTGGFAIELMSTLLPGTMVHGQLRVGEKELPFTGTVTWSFRAEPRLQVRGRAGVRFTGIDPSFFELFAAR